MTTPSSAPGPAASEPSSREDALPLVADALLLDMDGTLIDSGPSVERAWGTLLEELDAPRHFDHTMHGRPARQILAELLPELGAEQIDDAHRRIEELEIADVAGIVTLPGTRRVLEELEAAAELLGRPTWTIVTSCTRPLFEARWARTGLPVPAHLVTADQVTRGKPDPEPFLLGARRLGVPGERTIVVEDSAGGLTAGRAAGARTVALTTTTPADSLSPLADALVTSLDDLEVAVVEGTLRLGRRGA